MIINVAALREKPQVNWQVPFEWMTKMSNEELDQWLIEAVEDELSKIKAEGRPISADPHDQERKFVEEAKARVRDLARMIEIDYTKVIM
jgi:hypothetical protein